MSKIDYVFIFIPLILNYVTTIFCKPGGNAGGNVWFRPSPIVFTVIWPILYILLGIAWYLSRKEKELISDILFSTLSLLLCLWIFMYSCKGNKKYAMYILLVILCVTLLCYNTCTETARYYITPLIAWIIFALMMSAFEK